MAVTLTLTDVDPGTTQLYAFGTVQLSGNYPSGGDTVDWTQLAKQITARGQTVDSSMTDPAYGPIQASFTVQGGTPNQYQMQREPRPITGKCAVSRPGQPARNSPAALLTRLRPVLMSSRSRHNSGS